MTNNKKIWLISGSGSGLGKAIAHAALKAGYTVAATARNPAELNDLQQQYGEQVFPATLDVTNEIQAKEVVETVIGKFGRIDVLINNAGYGDNRPFEQIPAADFRRLVETCFFGAVTLCREVIPHMRKQKSGHIIQISSVGGRIARPGNAAYHASKWALGGFSDSLAAECSPFGVQVTALEPGGMRTNWGKRAYGAPVELLPEYEASVGEKIEALKDYWGNETGDPDKVAEVVVKVSEAHHLPSHLLLGSDAYFFAQQANDQVWRDATKWKAVSEYIDFSSILELPDLPTA